MTASGAAGMNEASAGKIVFASNELPAELGDQARFSRWRDIYTALYGDAEITRLEAQPFASRSEFKIIGDVGIAMCAGTFGSYARTHSHVTRDTRGDFFIGFLRGETRMKVTQHGREVTLTPGEATFYSNAEAYECVTEGAASVSAGVCVPRARVLERVARAEDLFARRLDASQPAVQHLGRYMEFLLGCDELSGDPRLTARINETLLDLVVLSLGVAGDTGQLARMRGLRAARLQQALAEIDAGFADPAFSPHLVARKLGVTTRYLQKLMHDTGVSFTERVQELRLQRVRSMLADARNDRLRISEIAAQCGFNDVSHFNHCFRRRFGISPTQCRGG
jgi:AraC-like DNA-binding protein